MLAVGRPGGVKIYQPRYPWISLNFFLQKLYLIIKSKMKQFIDVKHNFVMLELTCNSVLLNIKVLSDST